MKISGEGDTYRNWKDKDVGPLYADKAEVLKALGHPVRLCIVRNLLLFGRCNVRHMEECLSLPQSTISQHLSILRARGIIQREKIGTEAYYCVSSDEVKKLMDVLFPREEGRMGTSIPRSEEKRSSQ